MIHLPRSRSLATLRGGSIWLMSAVGFAFESFSSSAGRPVEPAGPAYWFLYQGTALLVAREGDAVRLPFSGDIASLGLSVGETHFLGTEAGHPCLAAELTKDVAAPPGWSFEGLRALFGAISDGFYSVAARASEIIEWDRTHRFCGRCGTAMRHNEQERARECPSCGLLCYPRISPAVIVAVVREGRLLLACARRFPPGFYSVLAGFVEAGETLEECAHREVREETGIEITDLSYFASQPWPFPHSLMVAFTARHQAGEIVPDPSEIVDAAWYPADSLPEIPHRMTVARRLIDWFVQTHGAG
jgi:NAD+ diphosphatase